MTAYRVNAQESAFTRGSEPCVKHAPSCSDCIYKVAFRALDAMYFKKEHHRLAMATFKCWNQSDGSLLLPHRMH
eukprot:scaffold245318_cov19-Prasinocladus_malaysianus.AAC.1